MPGSNPLFGLNTLGGALSVQHQERASRIPAPRFRRATGATCAGRSTSSTAAPRRARSTGTSPAPCSPRTAGATTRPRTCARSSASWAGTAAAAPLSVTVAHARNALNGNALQETRLLERDAASVYTKPDDHEQPRDVRERGAAPRGFRRGSASPATSTTATSIPGRSTATSTRIRSIRTSFCPARRRRTRRFPRGAASATCAQRRAGREVQRPPEPHAHRAAQRRRLGPAHALRLGGGPPESAHRRRRVRPQPRGLHAVVRARLPESGSQHHGRRRVRRRWGHRWHGRWRAVRHARRSRRAHHDVEPVRDRHAVVRRPRAPHRGGALQPHDGGESRRHPARRRRRARSTGRTCSRAFNPAAGVTVNASRRRQPLRRLQRGQPGRDLDRARVRRSRSSRASCPTRWPATRRCRRS